MDMISISIMNYHHMRGPGGRARNARFMRKILFTASMASLCLIVVFMKTMPVLEEYWNSSNSPWPWWLNTKYNHSTIAEMNTTKSTYLANSSIFGSPDIEQDDKRVIAYIRQHYVFPPPKQTTLPSMEPVSDPSEWKVELGKIFNKKKNGFFIECGANDGIFLSNTYKLEKADGWTGLLIEANPDIFPSLRRQNRNGWISNACLSMQAFPVKEKYLTRIYTDSVSQGHGMIAPGGHGNPWHAVHTAEIRPSFVDAGLVDCFPLYSILLAIDVTTVDYLSLDVEMVEYKVLKHIPFDKITIKVISVEHNRIPEGKDALVELLQGNGYEKIFENYAEMFFVLSGFKGEFFKA